MYFLMYFLATIVITGLFPIHGKYLLVKIDEENDHGVEKEPAPMRDKTEPISHEEYHVKVDCLTENGEQCGDKNPVNKAEPMSQEDYQLKADCLHEQCAAKDPDDNKGTEAPATNDELDAMVVLGGQETKTAEVIPFAETVSGDCQLPPYPLGDLITLHSAFLHESKLTVCGGMIAAYNHDLAGAGGSTKECYILDPASGQWTHFADMSSNKYSMAAISGTNGLMVTGGSQSQAASNRYTSTMEKYNPVSKSFDSTGLTPMPTPATGHCIVELDNGNLAIIGGKSSSGTLNTVQLYNVQGNSWSKGSNMRLGRDFFGCVNLGCGKIFVAGGGAKEIGTSEIYDVATDTWTDGPSLPPPGFWRRNVAVIAKGVTLLVGGRPNGNAIWKLNGDICTAADPATLGWVMSPNQLSEDRNCHTATMVPKSALPKSCLTENK